MSNIPNFVEQVRNAEQLLKADWVAVQEEWKDGVAEGFNDGVVEPYMLNFKQYLTGEGINGYGLEHLLQQMDKHLQDMDALAN